MSKQLQHPSYVRAGKVAFRFLACEQQVHQVVIAQFEEARERAYVGVAEVMLVAAEKTLENQIVFEQAAAGRGAAPRRRPRGGGGL